MTYESLVTELQVQRLVWRERLEALRVERDRVEQDLHRDGEFNQYYGAIENMILVLGELDHILEDLDDDTPPSDERPDLGWWCIEGVELLYALRKCNRGEDADAVYCELYANCRIEKN